MISKIELDPTSMNEAMMTCLYFETIIQVFNYSTFKSRLDSFVRMSVPTHWGKYSSYWGVLIPSSRVRLSISALIATSSDEPDIESAAISGRSNSPKAG